MGLSRNGPEINVTPLIDILLVLLVIFLVVMPAMLTKEEVETPQPAGPTTEPFAYLTVKVHADSSVTLVDGDDGTEVQLTAGQLPASLRTHLRSTVHIVFVDTEDTVQWGQVVGTIDTIRGVAGDTHVALKLGGE
jgi:biopolymer transport protein ExbD